MGGRQPGMGTRIHCATIASSPPYNVTSVLVIRSSRRRISASLSRVLGERVPRISRCKLEYELFHDNPTRDAVPGALSIAPGTLVVFNGDKLWHRITPAAAGDRRIALTLEYVTSHAMHPLRRFMSNMKDAIAYFGFRQVFSGARRR